MMALYYFGRVKYTSIPQGETLYGYIARAGELEAYLREAERLWVAQE